MLSRFIRRHPQLFENLKGQLRDVLPISAAARGRLTGAFNNIHAKYFQNYVFIHIPKCGGTSVERALGLAVLNHDTALERFHALGEKRWRERVTFAVVRNPYARLASSYFYLHQPPHTEMSDLREGFRFWMSRWQMAQREGVLPNTLKTQCWWLSDEAGQPLVDIICQLENIEGDFKPVAEALGREINIRKLKENPLSVDYDDLYTPATRDMVKSLYEEDFERFGYAM